LQGLFLCLNFKIMIDVNEKGLVSARGVHKILDIKERFSAWIENAFDFFENEYKVTPYVFLHPQNKQEMQDYYLPLEMAKEICMTSKNGKELRKYLLSLDNKKQGGLLLSHAEILGLQELVIACLFEEYRKLAKEKHLTTHLPRNAEGKDWGVAQLKRNSICGIDKYELEQRLKKVNVKYANVEKALMQIDKLELIRIAVIDTMLHFGKTIEYARNVGDLAKEISKARINHFDRAKDTMFAIPIQFNKTISLLQLNK
jgi:phage anti-repressor protein